MQSAVPNSETGLDMVSMHPWNKVDNLIAQSSILSLYICIPEINETEVIINRKGLRA